MANRLISPRWQVLDPIGTPYAGALLYSYSAGTSTPKPIYSDAARTMAHANPVIADSAGYFPDLFPEATGSYKLVLQDAAGVQIWAADDVDGASVASGGGATTTAAAPNLLINPDFRIAERTPGSTADGAYGIDRWYALAQTGSVTVATFDTAGLVASDRALRLTQPDATPKRIGIAQAIESRDCTHLRGGPVAFSGMVRTPVAGSAVRYAILGFTGTADSITRDVVSDWTSASYESGGFFSLTNLYVVAVGSVTPTAVTWTTLPTITGTVSTSTTNLIVLVWTESTTLQTAWLDLTNMQVNAGTVATPYAPRPVAEEQALCGRYYQVVMSSAFGVAAAAGASGAAGVPFRSLARTASPTVTSLTGLQSVNIASSSYDFIAARGARYVVITAAAGTYSGVVTTSIDAEL